MPGTTVGGTEPEPDSPAPRGRDPDGPAGGRDARDSAGTHQPLGGPQSPPPQSDMSLSKRSLSLHHEASLQQPPSEQDRDQSFHDRGPPPGGGPSTLSPYIVHAMPPEPDPSDEGQTALADPHAGQQPLRSLADDGPTALQRLPGSGVSDPARAWQTALEVVEAAPASPPPPGAARSLDMPPPGLAARTAPHVPPALAPGGVGPPVTEGPLVSGAAAAAAPAAAEDDDVSAVAAAAAAVMGARRRQLENRAALLITPHQALDQPQTQQMQDCSCAATPHRGMAFGVRQLMRNSSSVGSSAAAFASPGTPTGSSLPGTAQKPPGRSMRLAGPGASPGAGNGGANINGGCEAGVAAAAAAAGGSPSDPDAVVPPPLVTLSAVPLLDALAPFAFGVSLEADMPVPLLPLPLLGPDDGADLPLVPTRGSAVRQRIDASREDDDRDPRVVRQLEYQLQPRQPRHVDSVENRSSGAEVGERAVGVGVAGPAGIVSGGLAEQDGSGQGQKAGSGFGHPGPEAECRRGQQLEGVGHGGDAAAAAERAAAAPATILCCGSAPLKSEGGGVPASADEAADPETETETASEAEAVARALEPRGLATSALAAPLRRGFPSASAPMYPLLGRPPSGRRGGSSQDYEDACGDGDGGAADESSLLRAATALSRPHRAPTRPQTLPLPAFLMSGSAVSEATARTHTSRPRHPQPLAQVAAPVSDLDDLATAAAAAAAAEAEAEAAGGDFHQPKLEPEVERAPSEAATAEMKGLLQVPGPRDPQIGERWPEALPVPSGPQGHGAWPPQGRPAGRTGPSGREARPRTSVLSPSPREPKDTSEHAAGGLPAAGGRRDSSPTGGAKSRPSFTVPRHGPTRGIPLEPHTGSDDDEPRDLQHPSNPEFLPEVLFIRQRDPPGPAASHVPPPRAPAAPVYPRPHPVPQPQSQPVGPQPGVKVPAPVYVTVAASATKRPNAPPASTGAGGRGKRCKQETTASGPVTSGGPPGAAACSGPGSSEATGARSVADSDLGAGGEGCVEGDVAMEEGTAARMGSLTGPGGDEVGAAAAAEASGPSSAAAALLRQRRTVKLGEFELCLREDLVCEVLGLFHPQRYLENWDCVECPPGSGIFISRSHFEKIGGAVTAKWYRSIRVLPNLEHLGVWLLRNGLPVFKGGRRRRRRIERAASMEALDTETTPLSTPAAGAPARGVALAQPAAAPAAAATGGPRIVSPAATPAAKAAPASSARPSPPGVTRQTSVRQAPLQDDRLYDDDPGMEAIGAAATAGAEAEVHASAAANATAAAVAGGDAGVVGYDDQAVSQASDPPGLSVPAAQAAMGPFYPAALPLHGPPRLHRVGAAPVWPRPHRAEPAAAHLYDIAAPRHDPGGFPGPPDEPDLMLLTPSVLAQHYPPRRHAPWPPPRPTWPMGPAGAERLGPYTFDGGEYGAASGECGDDGPGYGDGGSATESDDNAQATKRPAVRRRTVLQPVHVATRPGAGGFAPGVGPFARVRAVWSPSPYSVPVSPLTNLGGQGHPGGSRQAAAMSRGSAGTVSGGSGIDSPPPPALHPGQPYGAWAVVPYGSSQPPQQPQPSALRTHNRMAGGQPPPPLPGNPAMQPQLHAWPPLHPHPHPHGGVVPLAAAAGRVAGDSQEATARAMGPHARTAPRRAAAPLVYSLTTGEYVPVAPRLYTPTPSTSRLAAADSGGMSGASEGPGGGGTDATGGGGYGEPPGHPLLPSHGGTQRSLAHPASYGPYGSYYPRVMPGHAWRPRLPYPGAVRQHPHDITARYTPARTPPPLLPLSHQHSPALGPRLYRTYSADDAPPGQPVAQQLTHDATPSGEEDDPPGPGRPIGAISVEACDESTAAGGNRRDTTVSEGGEVIDYAAPQSRAANPHRQPPASRSAQVYYLVSAPPRVAPYAGGHDGSPHYPPQPMLRYQPYGTQPHLPLSQQNLPPGAVWRRRPNEGAPPSPYIVRTSQVAYEQAEGPTEAPPGHGTTRRKRAAASEAEESPQ